MIFFFLIGFTFIITALILMIIEDEDNYIGELIFIFGLFLFFVGALTLPVNIPIEALPIHE